MRKRIAQKQLGLFSWAGARKLEKLFLVDQYATADSVWRPAIDFLKKNHSDRDWSSLHDFVAAPGRLSIIKVLKSPYKRADAKKCHKSQSRTERNLLTMRSHVGVTFRVQVELMRKGASAVVYHPEGSAGHVPIQQRLGCVVMVAVIRHHFTRP